MKKVVAILLMVVLLVGLCGCKREPLRTTRVPIFLDDPDEGNIFHDVDIEWLIHYKNKEINEIEMRLIFPKSSGDYKIISYFREVNGEGRNFYIEYGSESTLDGIMNAEISSLKIDENKVSYFIKGKLTSPDGEQEEAEFFEQGIVDIEKREIDDQGNVQLIVIGDAFEIPVENEEMDSCYPMWTYNEKKTVSLLAQEMIMEFFYILSA